MPKNPQKMRKKTPKEVKRIKKQKKALHSFFCLTMKNTPAKFRFPTRRNQRARVRQEAILLCFLLEPARSHFTIDHASLSKRSTVPTPNRDTPPTFGRLIRLFHLIHKTVCFSYPLALGGAGGGIGAIRGRNAPYLYQGKCQVERSTDTCSATALS